ncbi:50S ribosomal protein L11 methyltransferase [Aminivibrio sp.]|jgi:ribosomal protein L11 methyltransferase|uniref:50S ribosomal protein L11 methyltransferase n=1 Tax=Aminivibrio sp. TaxID=1872489 RepID=UPI001A59DE65|nr:50S ribosomal protein L11 methyltransferase [Aminivibrio sp.]MBL3538744.1 50S ribosomal protein L11 methyltransferase [Aminivibrio sp.]MDK2959751.1 ribosomal protein methyltransferase [Synergistaceae bacterium]
MTNTTDSYWWYVTLEGGPGSEEVLASLAEMSGSIGSEESVAGNSVLIRAYYRTSQDLGFWVQRLEEALSPWPEIKIADMGKIENKQWNTDWKDAFPPLPVGEKLVVLAPWHKGTEPEGRMPLYIYPGSAFGTGYHESTQIVLTLMEKLPLEGAEGADIGTGSGILAIAAVKMGAAGVRARDLDPAVLSEVRHNLELNGIEPGRVELEEGNLLDGMEGPVNLLTANIIIEPLLDMLPSVPGMLAEGGRAIFSGLLAKERERFSAALEEQGLRIVDELVINDWWGVVAERNDERPGR